MAKAWPLSSILLGSAGLTVAGIGAFFILFRPPLLMEDILYMQLSAAELAAIGSRVEPWLTQVFRVLGGYALAAGVLTVALAATAFRVRNPVAVLGAVMAGASSVGLMVVVNFELDSRFKWILFAAAFVWVLSIVVFGVEEWVLRSTPSRTLATQERAMGPLIRKPGTGNPPEDR